MHLQIECEQSSLECDSIPDLTVHEATANMRNASMSAPDPEE